MDDLLESFLENMWVRIKHAEKSRVNLWDQSLIRKQSKLIFEVSNLRSVRAAKK